MSTIKTKVKLENVVVFLQNHYQDDVSDIAFVEGGESSQAFSFKREEQELIIRINAGSKGFEKDKYVFENFNSPNIPVPKVFDIGKYDDKHHYAISEKASGKLLQNLSDEEYEAIFPELVNVLNAIHKNEIPNVQGFGCWSPDGSMEAKTWKEYIFAVNKYAVGEINKTNLFETSFLEKDVWNKYYKQMESLTQYCFEEKYLIHGDYGSDNVTAEKSNVTGVFDWESSKYGDFLYDIAWLNFWGPERNPMSFFKNYYTKVRPVKNFTERILCYQLRIGLSSLSFYAFSNQEDKYESIKRKLVLFLD